MPLEHKKVCIIDDDDNIREIYSVKLRSGGFDVLEARDGKEGIEMIRAQKPDIVLLDLLMPVKSGLDVLAELEKNETISSIPVIVLSNSDSDGTIGAVGEFDTRFYFVKSLVTPQKILNAVREVLHC